MKDLRSEELDIDRAPGHVRSSGVTAKRSYQRPRLLAYGDLRTLTLGGSPGMGDSGPTVGIRKPL